MSPPHFASLQNKRFVACVLPACPMPPLTHGNITGPTYVVSQSRSQTSRKQQKHKENLANTLIQIRYEC